jgi:ubiquinone/menaquinone biosynthesis C-methylase UbiE
MRWSFTWIKELRFKRWLDKNASAFLTSSGIKKGLVVLDFGCGSGTYTIPAAKAVEATGRVYALDINPKALDRMERKAERAGLRNIVRIDASREDGISLDDEAVDFMLLIDVLQKIDNKEALFQEVHRVLKLRGVLLIFPMHLTAEEVERLATNNGLHVQDRTFGERILVAIKRTPVVSTSGQQKNIS